MTKNMIYLLFKDGEEVEVKEEVATETETKEETKVEEKEEQPKEEKTKKEFIFTRDGKKLLQIRKCTVYWNTRTIEIDRVQATLWNRSQDKKQPTDIKEPTNQ